MRDLGLIFKEWFCDFDLSGMDLRGEEGLLTACLVSLFTDRRADEVEELPAGEYSRKGWWGDAHLPGNDRIGSKLWLLRREKKTPATAEKARGYCLEALAWLVEDGHASAVDVATSWAAMGVLAISIQVRNPDLSYDFTFDLTREA